jgi:DNA-binding transcriptional MocR family regulator
MYSFSKSVSSLRSSEIRDLMKLATRPDIISFAGGMPNNDLFPIRQIDEIYKNLPAEDKKMAFQYGPTPGYPPLLEALKNYLRKKGLPVDSNELMITTGSMQAINILTQEFVDPGDRVICENPSFIGGISVFKSYQAEIESVPLLKDGIDLDDLEQKLDKSGDQAKLLYIIPNFHNPGGVIYSKEKRSALMEMMRGRDTIIIEDDAYGDLYLDESVKSLTRPLKNDETDADYICYTGSFSKILGPGFRLGWLLVKPDIYKKCELLKQAMDACSPNFTQVLAAEFLSKDYLQPYLEFLRTEYAERRDIMHESLEKRMPSDVSWIRPDGGFYYWLTLPEHIDATGILTKSLKNGAVFVTGKTFDPAGKINNKIRLSFSNMKHEEIDQGVRIIASAIKEEV